MHATSPKPTTSLAEIATGRRSSFFADDLLRNEPAMREAVRGRKILAIGGAGSIGSNTIFTLSRYGPSAIHVVDQNENGLAELIRQFRSAPDSADVGDIRALPIDYGAAAMELLLAEEGSYDLVLNFAAIKHVRSEKDTYSILQMLDTNIVKQARLMRWIAKHSPRSRYFSVSTDKAANPSSFMGATKRIMEHVMFADAFRAGMEGSVTSARFANVAFSNGSLLQSFENRLARQEAIACPMEIRRYFVSLEESGHICAMASVLMPDGHIGIPKLDPETCLVSLQGVAERFIRHCGYEPAIVRDEEEAKRGARGHIAAGRWPLVLTRGDTAGEKPYEEFLAAGETATEIGLSSMSAIPHLPPSLGNVEALVTSLEDIVLGRRKDLVTDKNAIKSMVGEVEPEFLKTHRDSALSLDHRM